jgi:hypothetical protein
LESRRQGADPQARARRRASFAGRPEDALKAFDRPGVAAAGGDDLQWSRAVAIEWLGRARETDAVLRALCAGAGPHRDRACAALRAGEAPLPQAR